MAEAVLSSLAVWQTFYVIIGTAAATLTGLLFVVITLVSGALERVSSPLSGVRVFNTPNVRHFGAALLIAALLSAPWPALWPAGLLVGLAGLWGVAYVIIVLWEVRHRLANYQLVLSDWLWYILLFAFRERATSAGNHHWSPLRGQDFFVEGLLLHVLST